MTYFPHLVKVKYETNLLFIDLTVFKFVFYSRLTTQITVYFSLQADTNASLPKNDNDGIEQDEYRTRCYD